MSSRLVADDGAVWIEVDDAGANYPIVVDPWLEPELQFVTPTVDSNGQLFGAEISADGPWLVTQRRVGTGSFDRPIFRVDVLQQDVDGTYVSDQVLAQRATEEIESEQFGTTVTVGGSTIVVGSRYQDIEVYQYAGPDFGWVATYETPLSNESFHHDTAVDGDWMVVGESGGGYRRSCRRGNHHAPRAVLSRRVASRADV